MSCVKCEGHHVILIQNSVIMLGVGNVHSSCDVAADAYEVDRNDLRGGEGDWKGNLVVKLGAGGDYCAGQDGFSKRKASAPHVAAAAAASAKV